MISELILKDLKKKQKALIICGILTLVISAFIGLGIATEKSRNNKTGMIVFLVFMVIISLLLLVCAIKAYSGGWDCGYLKKRPDILSMAREMDSNIVYEDDFIVVSDRIICAKKNPCFNIAKIEDVVLLYERIQRTNGIVTSHLIVFELNNGKSIAVSIYAKNKQTKNDILLTISHFCPNARVGYTNENLAYLREIVKQHKG